MTSNHSLLPSLCHEFVSVHQGTDGDGLQLLSRGTRADLHRVSARACKEAMHCRQSSLVGRMFWPLSRVCIQKVTAQVHFLEEASSVGSRKIFKSALSNRTCSMCGSL